MTNTQSEIQKYFLFFLYIHVVTNLMFVFGLLLKLLIFVMYDVLDIHHV